MSQAARANASASSGEGDVHNDGAVLPIPSVESLEDYVSQGGNSGLARARGLGPDGVIAELATDRNQATPGDFEAHLLGTCSSDRRITIPKLVDLENGFASYDERQMRKRPDWTYDDDQEMAAPS